MGLNPFYDAITVNSDYRYPTLKGLFNLDRANLKHLLVELLNHNLAL
jgi:hypothetical protein